MERGNSFDSIDGRRIDAQASLKPIILSKLLDSVKQCQSDFGAKNELATADDSRVGFLLSQLETALTHGIKKNSFLKDVTDLVTKFSPFDSGVSSTIWSLIKNVLNDQEIKRIYEFTYITTDAGRFRCWLRMVLNEKSLKRYVDMINSQKILNDFYEDWAFMRDAETTAVFAQIMAGLETILFALSTNDPDLNFPIANNEDAAQSLLEAKKTPQPILNVNRERKDSSKSDLDRKELKKRKPLVNLVSFDKDRSFSEADGQMRVILHRPASSRQQSTESGADPHVLYLEKPPESESVDSVFRGETPSEDADDLSIDCGSFDSNGEEYSKAEAESASGRPESESTTRKSSDAISQTNNIPETNLNRSALESLKQEHSDFVRIQISRMNRMTLEVSRLPAVSVGNAQIRDDTCESDSGGGQALADVYEKRLIELSQMHGELLELNENLIKQNRKKNFVNERLKKELIALRGPLPEDLMQESDEACSSMRFEERPLVNIWIPSAFMTGKGADVHHVYQVYVRIRETEWNVYRRYSDFLNVHNQLSKRDITVKKFKFPPKKNFGRRDKLFVDERRTHLEAYLRMLVNYVVQNFPEFNSIPVGRETLSQMMPFFR